MMTNRHYGRFVKHNTAATNIDQGVSGAEVDGKIVRESSTQGFDEHEDAALLI
jgi:hypothetical protein